MDNTLKSGQWCKFAPFYANPDNIWYAKIKTINFPSMTALIYIDVFNNRVVYSGGTFISTHYLTSYTPVTKEEEEWLQYVIDTGETYLGKVHSLEQFCELMNPPVKDNYNIF